MKVTDNANVTTVSKTIEDTYPNELSTTTAEATAGRINQGLGFIDTATWAISLLAIFIGAVGVINTMIMSVYERTREIGVLKAVGWKDRRILGMILGESVVLTLIAFVVGTVVAVVGVELLLTLSPSVGGIITPILCTGHIHKGICGGISGRCHWWFVSSLQGKQIIPNGGAAL